MALAVSVVVIDAGYGFQRVGSTALISQFFIFLYKIQQIIRLAFHVTDPKGQGVLTFSGQVVDASGRSCPCGLPFRADQSIRLQLPQVPLDHTRRRLTLHKPEFLDIVDQFVAV